jgi:hypothetical protein
VTNHSSPVGRPDHRIPRSRAMVPKRVVLPVVISVIAVSALGVPALGALGVPALGAPGPAAAADPQATVTVKIVEVKALDSLDTTSPADFYPQVYIGGQAFGGGQLEITDQDHITPEDWSFTASVPFASTLSTTTVSVELYDADGGLNGPRDHVDTTTGDSDRDLNETVRLLQCAQKVPDRGLLDALSGDVAGACDRDLVTDGESSDKASLKFRITADIPDSDGDGLYDIWETNGYDADGDGTTDVDLPAMGAKVDHKDLFLELDATGGRRLTRADIEAVKRAFAAAPVDAGALAHELPGGVDAKPNPDGRRGITLHVDTGGMVDEFASESTELGTCANGTDDGGDGVADAQDPDCIDFGSYLDASSEDPPSISGAPCLDGKDNDGDGLTDANDPNCLLGDNLGGGSIVTLRNGPACNLDASFYATKAVAFNPLRANIFRWGLLLPLDKTCAASGGWGEKGGNDFMVFNTDGGSVMHEFGHTLGLDHGGFEGSNCKPNYVSVMNYDHQGGVSRIGGGTILDYEPPRLNLDGSTRGTVPGRIDEASLDENALLDGGDSINQFIYTDANRRKVSAALNANPNYNADTDPPLDRGYAGNVDTSNSSGNPADCTNTSSSAKLDSQNDWLRISLPFRQFGDSADAPIDPETDPNLTTAQIKALDDEVHATDLHLTKTGPGTAVAGTTASYDLKVLNQGPNPATPVVTESIPVGTSPVSLPPGCASSSSAQLTCVLPEVDVGQQVGVSLTLAVAPDLVYNAGAPIDISNTASVTAVRGADPDPGDNTASATTHVVARADLAVTASLVDPPTELIIGQPLTVSISSTTSNAGPSTPMDVRLSTGVVAPAGASASPATQSKPLTAVATGAPRTVTTLVTLSCSQPGRHVFDLTTSVAPDRPDDSDPDPGNNTATQQLDLDCVVPVALNIKPGQWPNSVNRTISSDVPTAVLTTKAGEYGLPLDFAAATILATTVRFGPRDVVNAGRGALETHQDVHLERSYELDDRTRDADLDGVLHFDPTKAELALTTTQACVKGKFTGPTGVWWTFVGCDAIRIVK